MRGIAEKTDGITIVTVVYESELALLCLQARSMRQFLAPEIVTEIIVIDNSRKPMSAETRSEILREYGNLSRRVRILVANDVVKVRRSVGYSYQQILKLKIAQQIQTSRYLCLDAKNHLVAPVSIELWQALFSAPDGRIRVHLVNYEKHPHRLGLEFVLAYFGLDPEKYRQQFTANITPFMMDTSTVRALVADIEAKSNRDFASEFLENHLIEFFVYTAWLLAHDVPWEKHFDFRAVRWPIVWAYLANVEGVSDMIAATEDVPFFAIHRAAILSLDDAALETLSRFWVDRELFVSDRAVKRFVEEFKKTHKRERRIQLANELPWLLLVRMKRDLRRLQRSRGKPVVS